MIEEALPEGVAQRKPVERKESPLHSQIVIGWLHAFHYDPNTSRRDSSRFIATKELQPWGS
jgi:hypothetical protein